MIDNRNTIEIDSTFTLRKELIIIDDDEQGIEGGIGFKQERDKCQEGIRWAKRWSREENRVLKYDN